VFIGLVIILSVSLSAYQRRSRTRRAVVLDEQ
jgi:hypothetical protein